MSYPIAQLCERCGPLFESHWVASPSSEGRNTKSSEIPLSAIRLLHVQKPREEFEVTEEDASDDDSAGEMTESSVLDASEAGLAYEAPDWVTVVDATPEISQSYQSPSHHTITGLERSASNGCYLCTIFWDLVRDRVDGLDQPNKGQVDRLSGLAIARPSRQEGFADEVIQLELSYFVDGKQDAFIFTVGVILWRPCRMYSPKSPPTITLKSMMA